MHNTWTSKYFSELDTTNQDLEELLLDEEEDIKNLVLILTFPDAEIVSPVIMRPDEWITYSCGEERTYETVLDIVNDFRMNMFKGLILTIINMKYKIILFNEISGQDLKYSKEET